MTAEKVQEFPDGYTELKLEDGWSFNHPPCKDFWFPGPFKTRQEAVLCAWEDFLGSGNDKEPEPSTDRSMNREQFKVQNRKERIEQLEWAKKHVKGSLIGSHNSRGIHSKIS